MLVYRHTIVLNLSGIISRSRYCFSGIVVFFLPHEQLFRGGEAVELRKIDPAEVL
jgi:hypothetical protein